jgi:1-deoxy-D-xylulose-5-phosphate synthase
MPLIGEPFIKLLHKTKRLFKKALLQKQLFENMGFEYLGPIDGHNLKELITVINYAKSLSRPVIVHTVTQKGKGYDPSEKSPDLFHGIGGFDPETGEIKAAEGKSYSDIFGDEIVRLARKNEKIVAVTAAMPLGTGLTEFAKEFPGRFFDVGIAEQHAVTFSAAMAKSGRVPVFAVYSTFLQRGYDQIIHDAALQNLHMVFAIDRAGAAGNDGETHQGIYDLSYLSHIPNMTIMAPATTAELRSMLDIAVNKCTGPVAIRYPKGGNENMPLNQEIALGKGVVEKNGEDVLIIAIGSQVEQAVKAAEILDRRGISTSVINSRFLKPFDTELVINQASGKRLVAVTEDNVAIGGFCDAVRRILNRTVLEFAFPDKPLVQGSIGEQKAAAGIDAEHIAEKIMKTLEGDNLG